MPYKDIDKKRAYQNQWMSDKRNAWIQSVGGKCFSCGSVENLEVDHINSSLKTMNPKRLWSMAESNPLRVEELKNCQVLCYLCHKEKTSSEKRKDFKHGDFGMYKARKCRCELCRAANTARVREQRLQRKLKNSLEGQADR